jgi:hypothetical protein
MIQDLLREIVGERWVECIDFGSTGLDRGSKCLSVEGQAFGEDEALEVASPSASWARLSA